MLFGAGNLARGDASGGMTLLLSGRFYRKSLNGLLHW